MSGFVEDVPPASSPIVTTRQPSHTDVTRRNIAYWLLGVLSVLILGTLSFFGFGALTIEEMKEVNLLISPVLTLAGTAIGFYFGANQDDK